MRRAWRIVAGIAVVCLILGVVGIAVAFFVGSSPSVIQEHGEITEYVQRLRTNWDVFRQYISQILQGSGS